MSIRGAWAAPLATALLVIKTSCVAAEPAVQKEAAEIISSQLSNLHDKNHRLALATAVRKLELQNKFLADALRLLVPEEVGGDRDPGFLEWRNATKAELQKELEEPLSINTKYVENFSRLNRKSSARDRVFWINAYRTDVNVFISKTIAGVVTAIQTLPLDVADAEMRAVELSIEKALKPAKDALPGIRNQLESIGWSYRSQFGQTTCRESAGLALAAERDQMRTMLRNMPEMWMSLLDDPQARVASIAAINAMYGSVLSIDKEGEIIETQNKIRGPYCLKQRLQAHLFRSEMSMDLLAMPEGGNEL